MVGATIRFELQSDRRYQLQAGNEEPLDWAREDPLRQPRMIAALASRNLRAYPPIMIAPAELDKLSLADRLRVMEMLWESISRDPDNVVSPYWHKQVLDSRRAKIERGEAQFLTINELKARLRRRGK